MKLLKPLCILLSLMLLFTPMLSISAQDQQSHAECEHEQHSEVTVMASSCYICNSTYDLDSVGLCRNCQWAKCRDCGEIAYPRHEFCPVRDMTSCYFCGENYMIYENHKCTTEFCHNCWEAYPIGETHTCYR